MTVLGVLAVAAVCFGPFEDAYFVDASLDIDGTLLSWRFVDLDADGRDELVVAVRTATGERVLHVHESDGVRVHPEPLHTVPVLSDVLAWGVADVRAEEGRELLLLTRGGAWSYSLTIPGYRDNVAPLARTDLIYDLPDPRALPYWAYAIPAAGGDLLLLPGRDGFTIWGPAADSAEDGEGAVPYAARSRIAALEVGDHGDVLKERRGDNFEVRFEDSTPFLREDLRGDAALFASSLRYRAPALVDLDGDGFLDLVVAGEGELAIHRGGPDGPSAEPTRTDPLPEDLVATKDLNVELSLVDIDSDGILDLLAHAHEEIDGFKNASHRLYVYRSRNDGGPLVREKPDQVLRFEAAVLRTRVTDVDGDGRADLALRKLELPSLVETVTGLEFTFSYLVFLGERRGFARQPVLKQVETYDEDTVVALAAHRNLSLDCDGDGLADLVEIDLNGDVAIRRLRKESSLLRGERWSLEAAPWKRFERGGSIESLTVEDLNGDGLGDVVSASPERLTVLFSVRRGGGR